MFNEDKHYDFPPDFQDTILACLVKHPESFDRFGNILKPTYFGSVLPTVVSRTVLDYRKKYGTYPDWPTIELLSGEELRKIRPDENLAGVRDYIKSLKRIRTRDVDFVASRVVDFARYQAVVDAVKQTLDKATEREKFDSSIVQVFTDAINVGTDLSDDGYLLHEDADRVLDILAKPDYGVKTGYPQWDAIWKRGWCPGWLIVPLAPPKRYKSALCINLMLNMVSPAIGEDVFYYACEISQELAVARCLYNLTGKTEESLIDSPEMFREIARASIREKIAGNCLIKGYPSKSVTISDIKAHAQRQIRQHGFAPKAIFIDYAETVASSNGKASEHEQKAQVFTEARAMGAELGCAIIMPDRCNRETVDKAVPNMKSFQGAFQKAGIVDAAIGLCATEREYKENILRSFVFLNRHGAAFQHFKGTVCPEIMQISVGEDIPFDPDEESDEGEKSWRSKKRKKRDAEDFDAADFD